MGMTLPETGDHPGKGVMRKLENGDTTHRFIPYPDTFNPNQNFQELLASDRFQDVITNFREKTNVRTPLKGMLGVAMVQPLLMIAFDSVLRTEEGHEDELVQLAIDLVKKEMCLPDDAFQYDVKMVKMGEIRNDEFQHRMENEPEPPPNIDATDSQVDIENEYASEEDQFNFEKAKRRMVNSIIQGSAKRGHYMYYNVLDELKEITDSDNVAKYYGQLMSINDATYWLLNDKEIEQATQGGGMAGGGGSAIAGKSEININTSPPTIKAKGICFPVLVHEIIKGVLEVFAVHGRPENYEEVEATQDKIEDEIWDLRLGPTIWKKLFGMFPMDIHFDTDKEIQNFLLTEIFKLPPTHFFKLINGVLEDEDSARQQIQSMANQIRYDEDFGFANKDEDDD